MTTPDIINGVFEVVGGFAMFGNVRRLYKDKQTRGVYGPVQAFFTSWGFWNLYYYPNLNQWMSFLGGSVLVVANFSYIVLMWRYRKN